MQYASRLLVLLRVRFDSSTYTSDLVMHELEVQAVQSSLSQQLLSKTHREQSRRIRRLLVKVADKTTLSKLARKGLDRSLQTLRTLRYLAPRAPSSTHSSQSRRYLSSARGPNHAVAYSLLLSLAFSKFHQTTTNSPRTHHELTAKSLRILKNPGKIPR
jgi:hypothetical protein